MTHTNPPIPGTTITLPHATPHPITLETLDFGDAGNDPIIEPITRVARLRWLNGAATDQQTLAIGWHLEAGLHPLIDETLAGIGMTRYVVEHRMADKDGQTRKPYWHLSPCSLIVVADGVLSPQQMRRTQERTGIVYAREVERDEQGEPKRYRDGARNVITHPVLKLRAFVQEMVTYGYTDWIPLTLTGRIVETLFEALYTQMEVLKAFSGYTGRKAPFYGFALPLGPAARKMVGPKQGPQSPIYPIVAQVPARMDQAYLIQHAVSKALVEYIHDDVLSETVQWSVEESLRIAQGSAAPLLRAEPASAPPNRVHPTPAIAVSAIAPSPAPPAPSAPPVTTSPAQDPLVQPPQMEWIVEHACQRIPDRLKAVCEQFGVTHVEQLRMSHFQALVTAKQQAEKRTGRA